MSTVEIEMKYSGRHYTFRDVSPVDSAGIQSEWVTGKQRIIAVGDMLIARDAIAWIRILDL